MGNNVKLELTEETPERRQEDKCRFLRFWRRWGPHLDLAGGVACLIMLGTLLGAGVHFVNRANATANNVKTMKAEQSVQHDKVDLVGARLDRMDSNIQLLMGRMKVQPLKKSVTEQELERVIVLKDAARVTSAVDDNSAY